MKKRMQKSRQQHILERWTVSNVPHAVKCSNWKSFLRLVFFFHKLTSLFFLQNYSKTLFFKAWSKLFFNSTFIQKSLVSVSFLLLFFSGCCSHAARVNVFPLKWFEWFWCFESLFYILAECILWIFEPSTVRCCVLSHPQRVFALIQIDTGKMLSDQPVSW